MQFGEDHTAKRRTRVEFPGAPSEPQTHPLSVRLESFHSGFLGLLGSALLSGNFGSEVLVALLKTFADHVQGKGGNLGSLALEQSANGHRVILDERLVDQRDFLEELLHGAFGDAGQQSLGLAGFLGLLEGDAALGLDQSGINAVLVQSLGLGGGDMHGNVVSEFFVTANHVDERLTDNLRQALASTTPADLQRLAADLLDPASMTVVLAGAL